MSDFDVDDIPAPRDHTGTAFREILERRMTRRTLLQGTVLAGAQTSLLGQALASDVATAPTFQELSHGLDEILHVPEGYAYQVVLAWGGSLVCGCTGLRSVSANARSPGPTIRIQQ